MIKINLLKKKDTSDFGGGMDYVSDSSGFDERETKISVSAILVALVVPLIICGFLYLQQTSKISSLEDTKKAKQVELETYKDVFKTLATFKKVQAILERKNKAIEEITSHKYTAVKLLDNVSTTLPDFVWLNLIDFKGGMLVISGNAFSYNLVSEFISQLKNIGHFYDIQLNNSKISKKKGSEVVSYSLRCKFEDKNKKEEGGK